MDRDTQEMNQHKTILVAPLNWGLGHATRCIPIIDALLHHQYKVLLGSEGDALQLLRKEFPQLPFVELPSYGVEYPKNGLFFKLKLLRSLPGMRRAIDSEQKKIENLVADSRIDGIISDNRPGVYSRKIPSVYLTHQVVVLSGTTSYFSSNLHQQFIKNFDICWIPDVKGTPNLSGSLGHPGSVDFPVKYLGPLSRMKKAKTKSLYDLIGILSGPEPQRSLLEKKLIGELLGSHFKVLLVRGVVEEKEGLAVRENITIANFMTTQNLQNALNCSKIVVCRSGYSSIMDLAAMEKKAFLIPTPGQYEQNYLARQLKKQRIAPFCKQSRFTLDLLGEVESYTGFTEISSNRNFEELFSLFEGK